MLLNAGICGAGVGTAGGLFPTTALGDVTFPNKFCKTVARESFTGAGAGLGADSAWMACNNGKRFCGDACGEACCDCSGGGGGGGGGGGDCC